MITETSKRILCGLAVLVFSFACANDSTAVFTVEDDNAAMARIANVWSDGTTTLSLCEDYASEPPPPYEGSWCGAAHVVRGYDRGFEHSFDTSGGVGCGGCGADVLAYVKGTYTDSSGEAMEVEGLVILETLYGGNEGDEGYALPYMVSLNCTAGPACTLEAELRLDGTLVIHDTAGSSLATLSLTGEASCELPPAEETGV